MRAAVVCLLLLAGCTDPDSEDNLAKWKTEYATRNPPGRYQMESISRNGIGTVGVIVLDTREGSMRFCQPHPDATTLLEPVCSGASNAINVP